MRPIGNNVLWIRMLSSRQYNGIESECSADDNAKMDMWSDLRGQNKKLIH